MPKKKGRAGKKRGSEDARAAKKAAKRERKAGQYLSPGDPDFKSLSAQLKVQGLALRDVPGDGNCLFRALAEHLGGHHSNLRRKAVDHMRLNADDFIPFLSEDQSLDTYCDELCKDGVYAGNDAIVAISRSCQVNIVIHQLEVPRWEVRCSRGGGEGGDTPTLHIAYLRGEHYCSVGPLYSGHHHHHHLPQLEVASGSANVEPEPSAKPMVSARKGCVEKVLDATGCKDRDLAEQCLRENNGDLDLAIVEVFQLMALSETCGHHYEQVEGGGESQVNNPRRKEGTSIDATSSDAMLSHAGKFHHLSNKERKMATRVAKNHSKVTEKSDQVQSSHDPVGSLPI